MHNVLVAESKFGLTEENIPPIFIVAIGMGSIPFLKVSIFNSFIYGKEIATFLF